MGAEEAEEEVADGVDEALVLAALFLRGIETVLLLLSPPVPVLLLSRDGRFLLLFRLEACPPRIKIFLVARRTVGPSGTDGQFFLFGFG